MALYTDEINKIVHSDTSASPYFVGVFPADKIPHITQTPAGIIFNLDDSDQPGSHWVGVWINVDGRATYFDSFGLPPLRRSLLTFLSMYPEWEMNSKRFQHLTSQDCGYYTILFIVLASRGFPLPTIQYLFYECEGRLNDTLVKDYIKFFTGWKSIKGNKFNEKRLNASQNQFRHDEVYTIQNLPSGRRWRGRWERTSQANI